MGVNESEIEGATVVPIQGVEVKDAGEFAAYWNSLTPENREAFVGALRDASDGWLKCFQEDHERELEQIRRLHEVATERTVQLAAVIEDASIVLKSAPRHGNDSGGWDIDYAAVRDALDLLSAADTSSALDEVRAKAWDEGFNAGELDAMSHETFDEPCITNPYRKEAPK